jgi:hypothetical protein
MWVSSSRHSDEVALSELLDFPAGKHDDQVDALGLISQILDRMGRGKTVSPADQKPRFTNEMTIDEIWQHAQPKRPAWGRRF